MGCIPIGSLRLLRLLRIVSLLVRLQKMGVIDLTETRIYRFLAFYFNVFIDEVSDRVIIRTLDDVKREITDESPVTRRVLRDISTRDNNRLVEETVAVIVDAILEAHPELGELGTRMAVDTVELVKDRVRVQHWKLALERRDREAAQMA